jgi:hypothetical protein
MSTPSNSSGPAAVHGRIDLAPFRDANGRWLMDDLAAELAVALERRPNALSHLAHCIIKEAKSLRSEGPESRNSSR